VCRLLLREPSSGALERQTGPIDGSCCRAFCRVAGFGSFPDVAIDDNLFRRLCRARDCLCDSVGEPPDLRRLSRVAAISRALVAPENLLLRHRRTVLDARRRVLNFAHRTDGRSRRWRPERARCSRGCRRATGDGSPVAANRMATVVALPLEPSDRPAVTARPVLGGLHHDYRAAAWGLRSTKGATTGRPAGAGWLSCQEKSLAPRRPGGSTVRQ
jgi:hypothetical protein